MKRIYFVLIIISSSWLIHAQLDIKNINIIPKPSNLVQHEGEFILDGSTKVFITTNDERLIRIVNEFVEKINKAKHCDISYLVSAKPPRQLKHIMFHLSNDKDKFGEEGYSIEVKTRSIFIEANQVNGIFYAIQSLYQLMPYQVYSKDAIGAIDLGIPCVTIFDEPRFKWRGNMLDASRHFISMDYIKQNLDYLASLKMNKFHWHLTDDQGWRIEIKSFPKLTTKGAWRVNRNAESWHARQAQQKGEIADYGGFYSQEDIKEIVKYASDRFIEVIPEIDIPGHSRAAIASYPEISCDEGEYTVATGGIMNDNTYCPGKEITFAFTEEMLNEVMDLFPSKYMHIGGDECNKEKWRSCNHCQKRIADFGLADENELQSYFLKRVEKMINTKGKIMIGWDEILEGGLAPNATVMSWRGTAGGITAAKAGHDVVMSPWGYCYLDLKQGDSDLEPDYGYGKLLLSTAYSFDPIPHGFSEKEAGHILGVQGNLWGESMQKPFDLNYMLFPRLFAISEVGWTQLSNKNFDDFVRRTEYAFNRLDARHINYAPSIYNVRIENEGSVISSDLHIKLSTEANNVEIRYTLDGSEPSSNSLIYEKAFPLTKSTEIKAQSFRNGKSKGRITSKNIVIHMAAGKKVEYLIKPHKNYNTSALCLTDCLRGNTDPSKEFWTGFRGTDLFLRIDLGEVKKISNVSASLMHNTKSWIFLPLEISCDLSVDGRDYIPVGSEDFLGITTQPGKYLKEVNLKFKEREARYIQIKGLGLKKNPDWHLAPGGENWIFIDEIMVN